MPGKPLEQMRKEYFALTTDKDRANYLWRNRIGGGVIGLSPGQYPDCLPDHEPCKFCGGEGEPVKVTKNGNVVNDWAIQCKTCGRRTAPIWSSSTAWRMWDDGKIEEGEQLNLFDMLEVE